MRVLLVTGEYPPMRGGVGDYTALLAAALREAGHEVSVLTSTRVTEPIDSSGIKVINRAPGWGPSVWGVLDTVLREERPDIVHLQYQTGAFDLRIAINLAPWLRRWRRHRPRFVVTFHDLREPYVLPKIGRLRHLATTILASGSDGIITTNHEDHECLADPADPRRASLSRGRRPLYAIPIGSNIREPPPHFLRDAWRERLGVRAGEVLIGYFGFIIPSKGLETLAAAAEPLIQAGQPLRLLMIGASASDSDESRPRGYEGEIRRRLDRGVLRERVSWTGFASASDVAGYLRACDLGCLPFREGASLRNGTLIAGITHGLPLVTTRSRVSLRAPGLPALIDGENVLLVEPGDVAALTRAIARLIEDPALRSRLAGAATALAERFDWSLIARQTADVYRSLVDRSG